MALSKENPHRSKGEPGPVSYPYSGYNHDGKSSLPTDVPKLENGGYKYHEPDPTSDITLRGTDPDREHEVIITDGGKTIIIDGIRHDNTSWASEVRERS